LRLLIGSWNVDAAKPEMLSSSAESVSFLADYLRSIGADGSELPDIIVFGFQEVIDLESRKLTASMSGLSPSAYIPLTPTPSRKCDSWRR